ncbi:MAG: magnesium transporter CorA family protein [Oscillospiraceae bacterium]|nr:magnesium transporter CorA family protein [Oscillospiraceae bacterium]
MLEYFITVNGRIQTIDQFVPGCWINLISPDSEELQTVANVLDLSETDFLYAALDPEESSRIEVEENETLLIVDIPMIEKGRENRDDSQIYGTIPMGIIVAHDTVVTVCLQDTVILRSIAENKVKNIQTNFRTRFVLQILLRDAAMFLRNLRLIERDFTRIEETLYESQRNSDLLQLLGLSKSLVYFSASLKANEVTMEKVLRGRVLKLYEDDRDLLEDALIEIRQAIEMASIYSSILADTMDAYASVVSNNLNSIMKVLAVVTIIMTIPNIIFGFYGMNIGAGMNLPFGMFWWVPALIAIVSCIIAWLILKRKHLT